MGLSFYATIAVIMMLGFSNQCKYLFSNEYQHLKIRSTKFDLTPYLGSMRSSIVLTSIPKLVKDTLAEFCSQNVTPLSSWPTEDTSLHKTSNLRTNTSV